MRIAILSPSLTTGDAVSNDVLGMYERLGARDFTPQIFAEGWTLTKPPILPLEKIRRFVRKPSDLLIYHYSRGWEPGLRLLQELKCRRVIKYHNVTPPEFLEKYSPDFANMCRAGRQQIKPIAQIDADRYLSASAFNMKELIAGGASESRSFVVPPFHHIDRVWNIEADQIIRDKYGDDKVNVLTVGRVSPNKGHRLLIEAFAAYHHEYNDQSRLVIVGKEETRLRSYSRLLREMVKRLHLTNAVVFAGEVSDEALKAYYEASDIFVTTSEHEGFCVPLIEAMAMKIPILAYGSSAIPETVGSAGLIWFEPDLYLFAESIHSIVTNRSISAALQTSGWQRYQELFTNERIENQFVAALEGIL